MNRNLFHIILLIISIQITGCSRQVHSKKGILEWEENFNQQQHFDETRWSKISRGTSDWDKYMSDFDSCYAMRNGKLVLRGVKNISQHNDTAPYLTGGVYTKGKASFGLGRIEVRAKLNGAKGAWPAFWMLAENEKWPDGGEIDIMERLSFDTFAYQTVHSHYTYRLKIKEPKQSGTGKIDPSGFNTYAVEKYRDSLVFFINNKKTFTYPRIQTDNEGQFPFDKHQHYLLLDMQLGGSWVGAVEPRDLPVEMEIDWVRFYRFRE